jgi:glycopeptide antibiotics resistance protein
MNTIFLFLTAFILMVIAPIILVFALKNHQKALKIITTIFACGYFVCLFIGTTADINMTSSKTTIDFDFTKKWFNINFLLYDFDLDNILINLFMFFPIGFIVYVFADKKPFIKTIILALILSIIVELYQFILPINRYTELTDLIFNTTSGLISACVCKLLLKLKAFKPNKHLQN